MRVRSVVRSAAAATAAVTLLGLVGTGGQSAPPVTGAAPASGLPQAPAEALAAAQAAGEQVEVLAERTETGQLYANPDGTFTSVQTAVPVRVRRGEDWVPVDTTLERLADGTVRPAAVPVSLELSGGGDGPLVRLGQDGRELALSWPAPLPAPELAGDTATYPDVLPDVDLRVRATAQGFSEVLVVKTREAASHPDLATIRFGLATEGLSVRRGEDGGLGAYDSAGELVFGSGPAFMWDSSPPAQPGPAATTAGPDRPGGRQAVAEVAVGTDHLSLRPDQELLTDPRTSYPVYIDPEFSAGRTGWTLVLEGVSQPKWNGAHDEAIGKSGYSNWESPIVKYRTYFQFNTARAIGTAVQSAEFNAREIWAPSCDPRPVRAYATNPVSPSTNWANQPFPAGVDDLGAHNAAYGRVGCEPKWLGWNATSAVRTSAGAGRGTTTILLKADNEGDPYGWKKWDAVGTHTPTLIVTYNSYPQRPTDLSAELKSCARQPNESYVNPLNPNDTPRGPTLRARVRDAEGKVRAQFEWFRRDGTKLGDVTTAEANSGAAFQATIPSSTASGNPALTYRVRGFDGANYGPWSGLCDVTIDRERPGRPPEVSSATYPENDIGGSIGRTGAFTFNADGVPDVVGFLYDLHSNPSRFIAANRLGGTATGLVTPLDDRPHDLFVRSVDRAGNVSDAYRYHFTPGRGTRPVAHWRLEGLAETAVVDSRPQRHDGTVSLGPARWVTGRHGDALWLNGSSGHVNTTNGQAVRTDQTFSVAAWVKLERTSSAWQVAVSQDGGRTSGFYLQYASDTGGWSFNLMRSDVDGAAPDRVVSNGPARVGVWTHLAGTFDQATGAMRLYVNGVAQQATGSHSSRWNATGTVQLGRVKYDGGHQGYWQGAVDDVRIYDRVVSSEEVATLATTPVVEEQFLPFEEGDGAVAVDVSGNHRTAQLGDGVSWVTGPDGGSAVQLPGDGGTVTTGRPAVRTDASFMVSAYVMLRVPEGGGDPQAAVSQDGPRSSGFSLGYWPPSAGWAFSVSAADSDNPTTFAVDSRRLGIIAQPGWAHLVGVYDAVKGEIRLYVNGELAGATAGRTTANVAGALVLGRNKLAGAPTAHWQGAVDDVHLWTGVDDNVALATFLQPVTTRPSVFGGQLSRFVGHGGDHLTADGSAPIGYHFEGSLGTFAPAGAENTRMLYTCRFNGTDAFTSPDPACEGQEVLGTLGPVYVERPEDVPTRPVYRCKTATDHFDSTDPECEGQTSEGLLGYSPAYGLLIRHASPSAPFDHLSGVARVPGDYLAEGGLGLAAMSGEAGTLPMWLCQDGGDSFISTDEACEGATVVRPLGGRIWTEPPAHLVSHQVFRCRASYGDLFESADPDCEGQTVVAPLGFLVTHL